MRSRSLPREVLVRQRGAELPRLGDDPRLLAGHLGLATASEVLEVAEAMMGDRLDPAARFFAEEIFGVE